VSALRISGPIVCGNPKSSRTGQIVKHQKLSGERPASPVKQILSGVPAPSLIHLPLFSLLHDIAALTENVPAWERPFPQSQGRPRLRGYRQRHLDRFFGGIVIELSLKYSARISRAHFVAIAVPIILAGFAAGAEAQSIQGSVLGAVKDKSGAVVLGAKVTLQSLDDGTVRETVSNGTGDYQFLDAPAGHYSVVPKRWAKAWALGVTGIVLS
jgi:hypothetical protein